MARLSGAAKSQPTESVVQLCCGTWAAGSATPAVELGLPWRGGAGSPPPRPGRKRPRRGARATWAGRGRRARRFRSCARVRGPRSLRSPPPGAAAAVWQLTRSRAEPPGHREGGGPAPPGARGARRVLQLRLAGRPRARRVTRGGVGWRVCGTRGEGRLGWVDRGFSGCSSRAQSSRSGFCPLDFAPASGRVKGKQSWVSDRETLLLGVGPGR